MQHSKIDWRLLSKPPEQA